MSSLLLVRSSLAAVALGLLMLGPALPARAQEAARAPEPTGTLLLRALTRLSAGDAAGAVTMLQGALNAAPDDAALLVALADATARTGDRTGARLHADAAVAAAPDAPEPALTLARLLADAGDRPGARRALGTFLARHDTAPAVRLEAARLAHADGDAAAARAFLAPLLAAPAPDVIALALQVLPDGDPARPAVIVHAIALAPDDPEAYARLGLRATRTRAPAAGGTDGRAAFVAGRYDEALQLLAAEAEADPASPVRWRLATMAALETGAPERAARLLDDARLIFAADAALAVVAAYTALARGAAADARTHADEAATALQDIPDARIAEALTHLRRVLAGTAPDAPGLAREGLAPAPGGRLAAALRGR